jgi:CRISPR-associated protein Csm5
MLNYRWTLRDICIACNEFFVPQLKKELELLQQLNHCDSSWAKGLENLLANEFAEAFREHKAFLLRVGQHGGAESNTLEGVRHIKIGQRKPYQYLDKPTTIWLAANHKDEQHGLLPFGWVLVEIGDFKFDKTHDFIKAQAQNDYELQDKLQGLVAKRREFLASENLKREKQALEEAQAIEAERLKEQAQQARSAKLAEMTPEQQVIFELKDALEKDKNPDPNGPLRQQLAGAIKQAENWTSEDKVALFEIGQTLCNLWGKPKKLKDQLKALQS